MAVNDEKDIKVKKPASSTTAKKTTTVKKSTVSKTTAKKATTAKKTTTKAASVSSTGVKKATVKKAPVKKEATVKKVEEKPVDKIEDVKVENVVNEIKDNLVSPIENDVNDQSKVYKILSYIGILWLIGLFVAEKDDKDLKFHVGQGMILTICEVALGLIVTLFNNLIIGNIFRTVSYSYFYGTTYAVSGFGMAIQGLLNLACFAIVIIYMVIGIKNAVSNKKNKLPLIGNWAFYK